MALGLRAKATFCTLFYPPLGESATGHCVKPKGSVELRDLDIQITIEEVTFNEIMQRNVKRKVFVSRANSRAAATDR